VAGDAVCIVSILQRNIGILVWTTESVVIKKTALHKKAAVSMGLAELTDQELLARVLAGDLDAYEGIMRHHNQRLFRLARSILTDNSEAMDIVQETYITAYQRLADLKNPGALSIWLSRITRNAALMRLRKSRVYQYMDEPDFENVLTLSAPLQQQEQPDRELANVELRRLLEQCIDELPETFRAVFMLRAVEQCSVSATAEILDIGQATVKTRFHRARLLLRKRILEHSEASGITVHEFAGHRCDTIVYNVLSRLRGP
jgi:RNA polymerase sigma-70 factor, ECF subfamily